MPRSPVACGAGREVLPVEEPPHELGGGHRLDGAAQLADRQAMDSRQEPPLAPLDRVRPGRLREAAPQDAAGRLEAEERLIDVRAVHTEPRAQSGRRRRADVRQPAVRERDEGLRA